MLCHLFLINYQTIRTLIGFCSYGQSIIICSTLKLLLISTFSLSLQCKDKNNTNLTIKDKSVDGELGTRTWGGNMEGADKSTEL